MTIDKIEPFRIAPYNESPEWKLSQFEAVSEVKKLSENAWLAIEEKNEWLTFALLMFASASADGGEVFVDRVLHGCGPTGCLRELRHTYWGHHGMPGYWCYPDLEAVALMAEELRRHFEI